MKDLEKLRGRTLESHLAKMELRHPLLPQYLA